MRRSILLAGFASFGLMAGAQTSDVGTATSFTPESFARFAPRTALDMVSQVPGFSIEEDENDARGFGQASGNVLIDGERISNKSISVRDMLGRIPADQVERIDLMDGTETNVPGLSGKIVNVVTGDVSGISGTWEYFPMVREGLKPMLDRGSIAVSGTRGDINWNVELNSRGQRMGNAGNEYVYDAARNLTAYRDEDFTYLVHAPYIQAGFNWRPANGHVANFNLQVGQNNTESKEESYTYSGDGSDTFRLYQGAEDEWNTEIGGDYAFDIGPGRLKVIGLARSEHSPFVDRIATTSLSGDKLYESVFERTYDEGEYILRGEYGWDLKRFGEWQLSLEGAFNSLESESDLFRAIGDTPLAQVPLPGSNSRVEETRSEMLLTHTHQPRPNLLVEASLGGEISEISQTGPNGKVRQFTRPKGYVQTSWQQSEDSKFIFRLERKVGQLDFEDFVSDVDLENNIGNAGNTEIVPEQSWELSARLEQEIGAWGAFWVEVAAEEVEDIVDRVPIGAGEGPGNIDSASRYSAAMNATIKLDPMGLTGGRIKFNSSVADTSVEDALTGETRQISDEETFSFFSEFRRDHPGTDWAYGLRYRTDRKAPIYYINSIDRDGHELGFVFMFIENKNVKGMKARFELGNLLNANLNISRDFYDNTRLQPATGYQERSRRFGPIVAFNLSGSF